jgi:DNA helicase-2/ATP-dependent DNA helicase PcrA
MSSTQAQEQTRVTQVLAKLHRRLDIIARQLKEAHEDTQRIEQSYGDATKVNITEIDDRMETNAAVQQQKMMVARAVENETILEHEQTRLTRLVSNPYFGRIDIQDVDGPDTLYIGTGTFQDDDNQFLIYDWRAPIASVYYNGTLGPVTYDTPVGQRQVDLTKKRQFMIQQGEITNMFDTSETVGDEILQAVLGAQSDDYMQNIVATIQQEQNDIIRNTKADVLVVQGVAGSGKTSAVLQRVAYLLYHARTTLDADQMVLFSPNQLFANYISEVLPSLGEKNMRQATMYEFFAKRFAGLHVQTLFERFEQDQVNLPETTKKIRRYKEAADYLDEIQRFVDAPGHVPAFIDIMLNGEVFFKASTIQKIYAAQPVRATAANKFLDTKNALIKRLHTRIRLAVYDDWVQTQLELMSNETTRQLLAGREFESGDDEAQFLAEAVVRKAFAPVYDAIYNDYFLDEYQEYQHFLATVQVPDVAADVWTTMSQAVADDLEAHHLRLEDAAPILYLRDAIAGSGQNHQIQYVFVDEMQDYTMAQLKYLHHAFPKAKLTLLGDAKQDVFTSNYQASPYFDSLKQVFKGMHIDQISLNKSYRSTQPITNFGKALLPESDHILAFNRDGEKPQVLCLPQVQAMAGVTKLANTLLRSNHTVAILTNNRAAAEQLYTTLKIDTPTHLLTPQDHHLHTGCLIMPVYLAKGLEFDAVIGWDVSADTYATEAMRDVLYTLCTRALHHLILIGIDQPSPLITSLPDNLYQPLELPV